MCISVDIQWTYPHAHTDAKRGLGTVCKGQHQASWAAFEKKSRESNAEPQILLAAFTFWELIIYICICIFFS